MLLLRRSRSGDLPARAGTDSRGVARLRRRGQSPGTNPGRAGSIRLPYIERASVMGPGAFVRSPSSRAPPAARSIQAPPAARASPGTSNRPTVVAVFVDARGRSPRVGPPTVRSSSRARRTRPAGLDRRPRWNPDALRLHTETGDLASVTDGVRTTRYGWNVAGQQDLGDPDPLGHHQSWGYDPAGRLVLFRDARGIPVELRARRGWSPRRLGEQALARS